MRHEGMRDVDGLDVAAELAGMLAATEHDRMPRVLITGEVQTPGGPVRVTVVEPCTAYEDGVRRGYLWMAYLGDPELYPSVIEDGRHIPGCGRGKPVATSTVSPAVALGNARAVLRRRGV